MTGKLWPNEAAITATILALVLVLVVVTVVTRDRDSQVAVDASSSTTSSSTMSMVATTSPSMPTSTGLTNPAEPEDDAGRDLAELRIDDGPPPGGYDRELFPTWLDLDRNGCDARNDVLATESVIPVERFGCDVIGGRWLSLYDAVMVVSPSELDIDHLVPLAEAWRSGADAWLPERRAMFANSLDYPDHLIAVTAAANRAKSDSPPDQWRPPDDTAWCRYARSWVMVKVKWELTATTSERDALGQMLETC